MNDFATANGRGPIVVTVLDQIPMAESHRLARIAEAAAGRAGMDVITADDFFTRYDGMSFAVSPWEGHPNEWANEIFASGLTENRGLLRHPEIQEMTACPLDIRSGTAPTSVEVRYPAVKNSADFDHLRPQVVRPSTRNGPGESSKSGYP